MSQSLKPLTAVAPDGQLEHQRLTSLMNSMADGVIAVDEHYRVVLYNAASLNLFDINTIAVGSSVKKLVSLVDANNQPIDITAEIAKAVKPISSRDWLLVYSDTSKINLYVSIAPVHLGYGEGGTKGYVLLFRDITREKSLEEERDEFISVVSHELRTPIAISEGNIGNAMYILEKSGDTKAVAQALKEAHNQVLFLADMINDLSTLSRAERGKLDVAIDPINVHELLYELESNYRPQAATKNLALSCEASDDLELLYSSKLYVREILQNFITNAIKYTETGSVRVAATKQASGVRFTVTDTGIGISKSDQERVFDKFFRSEDYRTRKNNGTGLGLYVTMKLTRLIHADIDVQSRINQGSVFTIIIPNLKTPE